MYQYAHSRPLCEVVAVRGCCAMRTPPHSTLMKSRLCGIDHDQLTFTNRLHFPSPPRHQPRTRLLRARAALRVMDHLPRQRDIRQSRRDANSDLDLSARGVARPMNLSYGCFSDPMYSLASLLSYPFPGPITLPPLIHDWGFWAGLASFEVLPSVIPRRLAFPS